MGSSALSSRPLPRPVVPRMTPLICVSDGRRLTSATISGMGAERGRVAKAYRAG